MQGDFQFIMGVLAVIGNDASTMIDCSEVLPTPAAIDFNPHFPAGLGLEDIEQAVSILQLNTSVRYSNSNLTFLSLQCASTPFPSLPTDPGPATTVAPV